MEANLGHPEGLRARVPRQDTRAALAQGKANNLDLPHLYNLEKDPNETANLATVSRRTRRALMRRVWSRRGVWKQEGPDEEGPDEEGVEQEEGVEAGGFGSACD